MPNWIKNELTVCGEAEKMNEFVERLKGTDERGEEKLLDENAVIPYPVQFIDMDRLVNEWSAKWEKICNILKSHGHINAVRPERKQAWEKFKEENGNRPTDGYNQGGQQWREQYWGTKWGLCNVKLVTAPWDWKYGSVNNKDKITLEYGFDTVWNPPLPLIKRMGEKFPELKFDLKYFGDGLDGNFTMENGEKTSEE